MIGAFFLFYGWHNYLSFAWGQAAEALRWAIRHSSVFSSDLELGGKRFEYTRKPSKSHYEREPVVLPRGAYLFHLTILFTTTAQTAGDMIEDGYGRVFVGAPPGTWLIPVVTQIPLQSKFKGKKGVLEERLRSFET